MLSLASSHLQSDPSLPSKVLICSELGAPACRSSAHQLPTYHCCSSSAAFFYSCSLVSPQLSFLVHFKSQKQPLPFLHVLCFSSAVVFITISTAAWHEASHAFSTCTEWDYTSGLLGLCPAIGNWCRECRSMLAAVPQRHIVLCS